ncbi:MAG: hypothetical protein JNL82_41850 [Myxococcales bacterium]|nr:hypothetical protein [Myxococcales bacterium]
MRPRPLALLSLAAASLAPACARDVAETSGFSGGGPQPATSAADSSSTGSSGDTSTGSSGSSGSTSTSSGSTNTGEDSASTAAGSAGTWDMGPPPDFDLPPPGCQGKIDFLFVISSHFEMTKYQDRLKAAFPVFVGLLGQELADFDYQIMVVDADHIGLLGEMCYDCEVMTCGSCQVPGCPEDYPCGPFVECDVTYGAGVTVVGNFGGSNKRCPLATEHRYITTADAATLEESFACIATLGAGPKTPVVMESMMEALEPDILKAGGCNDGFVRPDALLVVVVVQANQDNLSPGTPESWYDTLVTVKGGNEEAVVVLVISEDSAQRGGVCPDVGLGDNTLRIFAETAVHGRFLSVCEADYGPFLKEGAALALDQCAVLVPQ